MKGCRWKSRHPVDDDSGGNGSDHFPARKCFCSGIVGQLWDYSMECGCWRAEGTAGGGRPFR